uniref:uncharacterized protein LOC124068278 isoform X2 n=1 Tax=Scatophagus argus TaxID=75038 RepID=UPI001ED7D845|nr:uncharacterized protein LOC124068278 isoform X2 [Scatophagus argus]
MIVLLLLAFCFSEGLSYDNNYYGGTFRIIMHKRAQSIEFTSRRSSEVKILWKRDDPPASEDSRRRVIYGHFVISNLTQQDSGRYIMRDKDKLPLYVKTIEVRAKEEVYVLTEGERFSISFYLEPQFCNIYFFSYINHGLVETKIVLDGRLVDSMSQCSGIRLLKPCGILNEDLEMPCRGRYEIRDSNGNNALMVTLEMERLDSDTSASGVGIGLFTIIFPCCCTCLWHCCCHRGSSKKGQSETPDGDQEPVGQRPEQHSPLPPATRNPTQPPHTPTGPLIHPPPAMDTPPAYSEIHPPPAMNTPPAYSEVSAQTEDPDPPAVPVDSDPEVRFELQGMAFPSAPLLSSDSGCSDVYTSDKLNFL